MESEQDQSKSKPSDTKDETSKEKEYSLEVPLEKGVISRIIKALRNLRNYSQTRLGRILGVQKTQISKLEKGDANITIGTMLRVISALKAQVTFKITVDQKKELEVLEEVIKEDKTETEK
ncbi:MAG: helix-turn-helix domain-containing protein [Bacteroidota bacterium]|nr:helix-turn-helix domain-containing protein [Bacteroidota bacterium]